MLGLLTALGLAGAASADTTLFFDDFETATLGLNTTPSNWALISGTVDVLGPGTFGGFCSNGTNCVDLDGSSGTAGAINSIASFNLDAQTTYTLSFDYTNNGTGTNTLNWGLSSLSETLVVSGPSVPYSSTSATFSGLALQNASIIFSHEGGDNQGVIIDNVRLTASVAPVPLPAAGLLLLGGLGGLVVMRRKGMSPQT
ncbi:MAG: VPLPA-CTERM sorting domain-containing protein [Pseudomonadota bacterium]